MCGAVPGCLRLTAGCDGAWSEQAESDGTGPKEGARAKGPRRLRRSNGLAKAGSRDTTASSVPLVPPLSTYQLYGHLPTPIHSTQPPRPHLRQGCRSQIRRPDCMIYYCAMAGRSAAGPPCRCSFDPGGSAPVVPPLGVSTSCGTRRCLAHN